MFKRRLWIALCVFGIGAALGVQAQDDQPLTQPTVDAAVSTLLAQTQQAPTQIAATQTIQAALEQALTATGQPSPTQASSTPSPTLDVGSLEVISTTAVDLMAGPGRTAAYLAPNGAYFAYLEGDSLCLYAGAEQQNCVELPDELHGLDPESIRWSPDSRYLVFHENFFVYLVDSDIWVWDTETSTLTDLTDDGANRLDFNNDTWKNIDVLADWLDDGRIVFLRYNRIRGEAKPVDIFAIAPAATRPEKLGTLPSPDPFAIYALDAAGSQIAYVYYAPGGSDANGIWISNLDGSDTQMLAPADEGYSIVGVEMSPDGRHVLIPTYSDDFTSHSPEDSRMRVIDMESQTIMLIDPDRFVAGAGWSPDGSALVYLINDPQNPDENGLYITDTPGTPGRLLLAGSYNQSTPQLKRTLTWGSNNTILLSRSPMQGIVLVQLGS